MAKTASIHVRVEPELKAEGERVLREIGLSSSDFISMTYRQLVMRQGLPFDARIPNAVTIAALEEDVSTMPSFSSVEEMMDHIVAESDEDDETNGLGQTSP